MPAPNPYPISAAALARRLGVNGTSLRDVLRAHPELVPGHKWGEDYQIDRDAEQRITAHPKVKALPRR